LIEAGHIGSAAARAAATPPAAFLAGKSAL